MSEEIVYIVFYSDFIAQKKFVSNITSAILDFEMQRKDCSWEIMVQVWFMILKGKER